MVVVFNNFRVLVFFKCDCVECMLKRFVFVIVFGVVLFMVLVFGKSVRSCCGSCCSFGRMWLHFVWFAKVKLRFYNAVYQ